MSLTLGTPSLRRATVHARTLFALIAFTSVAAHAQQAALTLDAALQSATDRSAAMQAAQSSVQASSEAVISAGQLPDPMLKAGVDNLPVNGPQRFTIGQDFMTMRRIGIEQEWVSPEKRRLRSALASQVVDRERSGYLTQFTNTRQQTATAWLNAAYAKKAVSLQQELVMHMTHELTATQASYRGAKASAGDVTQAQLMLAQTKDQLLKSQQTLQTALIALSRWTAAPVTDVAGEPPAPQSFVTSLPPEELQHVEPALIAASAEIAVADADTAVANSDRSPNWSWEVSYQQRGGGFSNMVSVGVSIPLPINRKNRQDRDAAEKAELGTKARLMYEDTQRQVEADVRTLSATLANGRERIASLNQALLPAADQRMQLATAAYKAGTGSLADTFAARRGQLDAQLQVLDLQRDVSQTWAQLEYQVVPATMSAEQ
ncbi:outer membrane efflux family protein [Paraburkholderia fungorum]|jgi:outer membrane protein TolC|uniref:Outer membrane efflux family protein n=1 Tax=Paraburkholderia fungorum TaxID=134537 RepID=A0AAP5QIY2_9BURK|nr:TolC family protein [Paraburkholderia fungorum]AJZ56782.1 outer membrane efflux family protein [Paraburkholderia fungorum]MDT8843470.1 TolC family protein [Paraburkholderia fungorum]PRZ45526.1 outer membrane efflux protein [Paraburkholderia fungorum]